MSSFTPGFEATTDDVVAWLLGAGHRSCLDVEGRPLGEHASPLYDELASNLEEHREFGDVRDATGLPCNIAALRQLHRMWPVILSALESFEVDRPATLHRLYRRALAGTAFARLLALRDPARAVSVEAAALYKVTLGYGELLSAMLLESRADADEPVAEDVFAEWLADRAWLVGDAQVCAGARAQIRQVWRSLGSEGEGAGPPGWGADWFVDGLDAFTELAVLAASAAGAARSTVAATGARGDAACRHLYLAPVVPRLVEALRQAPGAGVAHPTLLFPAEEVPASIRCFVETFAEGPLPLEEIDVALAKQAGPAAARLMAALGRAENGPVTADAFRRACDG